MDRWNGKVALVTGASAGIGAATCVELVKQGLKVVGLARRVERVEALQSQVKGFPGKLYPLKGDVSKEEDINKTFAWIKKNLGTVHILINNAGIIRPGKLTEVNPDTWREILNTNVLGLCICTQQAFKLMKETGVDDGHIIHINSLAGHYVPNLGDPQFSVYPASKHAVTALTETLRQELRFINSKIKITSISPGYVDTEIATKSLEGTTTQMSPELLAALPEFPSLKAQDISEAVVYVLSTPAHVQVHELTIRPLGEAF